MQNTNKIKIKYYLNFLEDKRNSMDQYAERLFSFYNQNKDFETKYFRPDLKFLSKIIFLEKWKMRHARYISYPNQVKKIVSHDIAHICDHQYAHLVNFINSKVKIITVHDIIPIIFEKKLKKNPLLLKYSLNKLKMFDKILTVSESTKKDLLKYTDCPDEKIEVVMESIENYFDTKSIDKNEICKRFNIPVDKKKILISGSIFYKNNELAYNVLESLLKLNKKVIFLHIGSTKNFENIEKNLKDNIIKIPFIERKKLPEIYKICDLFFFPSIYEGFGLPVLEAMSCGLPIVCSNNSSLPEVVGNSGLISNCYDKESFVKNISNIIEDKKLQSELSQKSLERSKLFNETYVNNKITNIYKSELKKKINN